MNSPWSFIYTPSNHFLLTNVSQGILSSRTELYIFVFYTKHTKKDFFPPTLCIKSPIQQGSEMCQFISEYKPYQSLNVFFAGTVRKE